MQREETYYQIEITNVRLGLDLRTTCHDTVAEALAELATKTWHHADTVARVVQVHAVRTTVVLTEAEEDDAWAENARRDRQR
ncbi:hypothetical protein [Actinoalloteichus sp. GBA129-24]|uniref:hypothetical protein n=1 Tax=Actinoalloteichus sp. GBA129-24 TaxID=1612551 RepID=UPI00095090EC|nr:hypothetical protein [Actinoalloteichus sp. GBA129-24]APU20907.1 hypothetical protein UA75_14485 [Actinoalloteichus sp. GBA129-24]APU24156.1 hypothetical protein UA75_30965 [Actinoalloteichus sp. GBA129-24]